MPAFGIHHDDACPRCGEENGKLQRVDDPDYSYLCADCASIRRSTTRRAREVLSVAEAKEMLREAYRSNRTLDAVGAARRELGKAEAREAKARAAVREYAITADAERIVNVRSAADNAIARIWER